MMSCNTSRHPCAQAVHGTWLVWAWTETEGYGRVFLCVHRKKYRRECSPLGCATGYDLFSHTVPFLDCSGVRAQCDGEWRARLCASKKDYGLQQRLKYMDSVGTHQRGRSVQQTLLAVRICVRVYWQQLVRDRRHEGVHATTSVLHPT